MLNVGDTWTCRRKERWMPPKGAGKLGANETKNKNKPLSIAPQDADYLNIQQFCSIQQPEGKASLSDAKGS